MIDLGSFRNHLTNAGIETDSKEFFAIMDAMVAFSFHIDDEVSCKRALSVISDFGVKQMESTPLIPEDAWGEFDYGNVHIGEYVKVKPDAYESGNGLEHNNRLGVLTSVSGRRCTVRYITEPQPRQMNHPIDRLLSLRFVVKSKFNPTK